MQDRRIRQGVGRREENASAVRHPNGGAIMQPARAMNASRHHDLKTSAFAAKSRLSLCGAWLVAFLLGSPELFAQQTAPIRQRAVDSLTVKKGPRLLGAIVGRDSSGAVTIAVRRDWLKAKAAKFYEKESKAEEARSDTDLTTLLERIAEWRKQRADEKDLLPFLDRERRRAEKKLAARKAAPAKAASEFMLVTVPKKQIRSGFRQPARQRLVALYAWRERLDDVEARKASALLAELRKKNVDLSSPTVDLSDRLPPRPEPAEAWAARRAIVEYDALKRLRYQGTGDYLVRAGGDALKQPDITRIFSEMLNGQVNKLLAEALGDPKAAMKKQAGDALKKAIRTAETLKVRGFRVTRVDPDLLTKRVSVEEQFFVKMPNGKWKPAWSYKATVDASKPRPDEEKRIQNDEQVKQALKSAKFLGLGGGQGALQTAVRFGAATMEAQEKADVKFHEFRERFIQRLDTPAFRMRN